MSSLMFFFFHIEPINIFQGSYNTDTPPIRLSYHHGNHYNSLVDPHRLTVGAGLGFSSLTGVNVVSSLLCSTVQKNVPQIRNYRDKWTGSR